MPTTHNDLRREAIRKALTQRAGESADARVIAAATLAMWSDVATRLAPVIGAGGVDALFGRALYLAGAGCPWLAPDREQTGSTVAPEQFRARLEAQEAADAAAGGAALLATFAELLETLIGESLAERLLSPVWASPPSAPEQEKTA